MSEEIKEEKELIIREAEAKDAANLIEFLNQVAKESEFLTIDEVGILMTTVQMEEYLTQILEKTNNAYFIACFGDEIVGCLSVTADFHYRVRHVGEVFVAVSKKYQGYKIASYLFEDMLDWLQEMDEIKRLELTVQVRNQAAIGLYQKYQFETESIKRLAAKSDAGDLIDLYQMVRFFN